MAIATISSKHQITIPMSVRTKLRLREGDRVAFEESELGQITLSKLPALVKSDGTAAKFIRNNKRLTIAEIKLAARGGAAEGFERRTK